MNVGICQHCGAPTEGAVCEDRRACSKRVAKLLNPKLQQMVTKRFVGFDPDKAYREMMGDAS